MEWIRYLDLTLYAALLCAAAGVATYFPVRARYPLTRYSGLLVGFIAVAALVGFAAGFFGPALLSPDSPQGPLLGIFITGPVGAGMGLVAFWTYLSRHG